MRVVRRHSRHRTLVVLATLLVACAALPTVVGRDLPSSAAPGEERVVTPNPDLLAACGIDIHVVLDESSSINQSGATNDVRRAFRAFVNALNNTGSRIAVSEFGTQARLPLSGAAQQAYTVVTDTTIATTFEPYISTGYNPPPIGGANTQYTNWEDAMRIGRFFLPRPSETPHLVLFITDGDPTAVIRTNQVTQAEYETKVPLDNAEVQTGQNSDVALQPAIPNANAIKAQSSHILAIGVGAALANAASLSRLVAISGPDVFDGTGTFDISTTDVYREEDFALLEAALREAAFQLCAPSVNIDKFIDQNPDPAVDDLVPGEGWTMIAEVDPEPASWVLPPGATGSTATGVTGPDGFVNFQWTTAAPTDSSIAVAEEVQAGFFNDPAATTCSFITPDLTTPTPLPDLIATPGGFTATVPADAIVTCQMVNRLVPEPAIDIEKATNGADADEPPGPFIPVGTAITWTYEVTNIGNVPLSGLTIVDDVIGTITCPQTTIAPQASVTCTATGAAEPGPYVNNATATAVGAGETVTDEDPSHYTGAQPGIDIEKATNGEDADDAPGPFIPVGDDVTWTYVVTNSGDTAVMDVVVTDDQGVVVTCPQTTLAVGEDMTCTAPVAAAEAGQYENLGTVTAFSVTEPEVPLQDSDPSHYFGEDPGISIVKLVNGEDANEPTGPVVNVGDTVTWRFLVTNTGNVPLDWAVTDPDTPTPVCPRIAVLAPGESTMCFAEGPAEAGQQTNTATVTGTNPDSGTTVTDDDPANYFGSLGAITIEKLVNGDDADDPPGPLIPVGSAVDWTYVVTNTGNTTLTNILVRDTKGVTVTCPATELPAGGSMTCTASGTAEADEYTNFGIAIGETPTGVIVIDEDPAHFFGGAPGILVEKLTNGVEDLDEPPGVFVPVGDPVTWTFIVTNTGNVPLDEVALTDDQLGPVTCPQTTLAVGEEMTCTATGTAELGQYANTATVVGTDAAGDIVTDDDPSHHFGVDRRLDITKFVNGDDANSPPGLDIPVGEPVTMTFEVTNPGNVPMLDVVVTDDQGLAVAFTGGDTNGDGALDPGEVWTYEAPLGPATPGRFDNIGTVTGHDGLETEVTDNDPAFAGTVAPGPAPPGPVPGIAIEKTALEAVVDPGEPARFRITVTNTGGVDLTDVTVTDPRAPDCERVIGALAVGQSVTYECEVVIDDRIDNVATASGLGGDGVTVSDDDDASVEVRAGETLPVTGGDILRLVVLGLLLLATGVVVRAAVRAYRRRHTRPVPSFDETGA
jgi:hypothetical protein